MSPSFTSRGISSSASAPDGSLEGWATRPREDNDRCLREAFRAVLAASAELPPHQRLIMYDACDDAEIVEPLGPTLRKRLDPRRNTKPKKPDAQLQVCTPFDPAAFHFGKISNPDEILLRLTLANARYKLLTNKFPLFPGHMLLVADELVPQQLTLGHVRAVVQLVRPTSFCAYFNSWCASASVNHFHCHLIDEMPPVTRWPLVPHRAPPLGVAPCLQPDGFPGACYVFATATTDATALFDLIRSMQQANQPHNLLFTPEHVYIWPKPLQRPARSFELYPETVGGPELLGSFTVYQQADYEALSAADAAALCEMNTAPPAAVPVRRGPAITPSRTWDGASMMRPESAAAAADDDDDDDDAAADRSATVWGAPAIRRGGELGKSSPQLPTETSLLKFFSPVAASGWTGRRRDAGGGA